MAADELSRRRALQHAGVVGTVAVTGTAGCLGILSSGGTEYEQYLYTPPEDRRDQGYTFAHAKPSQWREQEEELPADAFEEAESILFYGPSSMDRQQVDSYLRVRFDHVYEGSFDADPVVAEFEATGGTEVRTHEGHSIYTFGSGGTAIAITDGTLIISNDGSVTDDGNSPAKLERIIDTNAGTRDPYVARNDDVGTLVDALGSATLVRGRYQNVPILSTMSAPDVHENTVASGNSLSIDGARTTVRTHYVYESSSDVDVEIIENAIERNEGYDRLDDVGVEEHGRVATITGSIDTAELPPDFF